MSNSEEQVEKIGGGIKAIAIINLVFEAFALIGAIVSILFKDSINATAKNAGLKTTISSSDFIIPIIISVLIIISLILILLKNAIGVIAYFIIFIGNEVYSIIQNGFTPLMLIAFILPILMAIFVYQKRSIFKIKREEEGIAN